MAMTDGTPRPVPPVTSMPPALPPPSGPETLTGGDWPAQAADTIVNVVDQVKAKTVAPATQVARGAVYGLLAAVLAGTILVLVYLALVRAMTEFYEWALPWGGVWLTYLTLGLICLIAGVAVFRKRYVLAPSTR